MRIIFKFLLVVANLFMAYLCFSSIMTPIKFEREKSIRDKAVIKRLMDIRKAQIEYKNLNNKHTGNLDSLINFVKTAQIPMVMKSGELTDIQLEKGLTEQIALSLQPEDAEKFGIDDYDNFVANFKRDTSYISVKESLFGNNYNIDSLAYVPYTNGQKFIMSAIIYESPTSKIKVPIFEAKVPFKVYLNGLDQQEIINLIDKARQLDKFEGLKVGDITSPNNNAGNWE